MTGTTDDDIALRGRLLVASTSLVDPNFANAVVLVLAHGDEGALGVVLNRPTEVAVADTLEGWDQLASDPPVIFQGGPVALDSVIGVGRVLAGERDPGIQEVTGRIGVVDLDRDAASSNLEAVRLFAGHAGWGPGQIEDEIDEGSWFVVDAEPDDVTTADPGELWRGVLVRQGGVFATFPEDPSLN